ncbi:MAG: V-type ATP synthase subunit B [Candidatus Micrarchaeota archaeon]|nr:V-type ATP synthase subunit B [Candidatus Micrarchaeota archaeon]
MLEYKTIRKIAGPLVFVEMENASYAELVKIKLENGEERTGRVLEIAGKNVVIQMFEGSLEADMKATVSLTGRGVELGVSPDMLGCVFDGMGRPISGKLIAKERLDINGNPINPYARENPSEFIETGISGIDVMNTLVRGQKLPIFSGAGMPHNRLAMQIARQSSLRGGEKSDFAVVFGAIGITFEEAEYFTSSLKKTGALEHSVMFLNLANDPAVERLITPRMALTAAEYLAYEQDMHVLVILTDMTNYCEALKEVSTARKEIPGRRAYPPYMYTDLATIYERAGRIKGRKGSITQFPILTMPEDDITHPIPDLTGYITEGQIVLSRSLHNRHLYPPFDILKCLSRLMNSGIGEGRTREDHSGVSNQLYSAYAKGVDIRELVAVIGEAALTEIDRSYLTFSSEFEKKFLAQGENERRDIERSLSIAWELFSHLPAKELMRVKPKFIEKYQKGNKN